MSGSGTPAPGSEGQQQQQQPAAWYAGDNLDAETVGYLQNRGWDKDVKQAALGAVKAHREAEKHLGVPADQIVRLPKDPNDAAAWKGVWSKLGAAADAAGYNDVFTGVKFKDGSDLDDGFKAFMGERFAKANLPKTMASEITRSVVEFMDQADAAETAERQVKIDEQKAALKKNWGTNEAVNMAHAKDGASRLGITPEQVTALESVIGYDGVMEALRKVGANTSEDSWIDNPKNGPAGGKVMTREQALSRKAELLADADWTAKWQGGDVTKNKEMLNLNSIILGGATE